MRIALVGGDPNSNGGRDSNGYYVGYLEGMNFLPPTPTTTPVTPEVRVTFADGTGTGSSNGTFGPFYADQSRVMCYARGITTGSPDSADDGFMLLTPMEAFGATYGQINVGSTNLYAYSILSATSTGLLKGVKVASGNRLTAIAPGYYTVGFQGTASGDAPSGIGSTAAILSAQTRILINGVASGPTRNLPVEEVFNLAFDTPMTMSITNALFTLSGSDITLDGNPPNTIDAADLTMSSVGSFQADNVVGTASGAHAIITPFCYFGAVFLAAGDYIQVDAQGQSPASGSYTFGISGYYWMSYLMPGPA